MDVDGAVQRLRALGCFVDRAWAAAQGAATAEALYAAVLGADFHERGVLERGSLAGAATVAGDDDPEHVYAGLLTDASTDGQCVPSAGRVAGPCVVQVDLVLDIGAPRGPERYVMGGAGTASPVRGALKLVCFDGRRTVCAVEKRPLFARDGGGVPAPGAKVLLRGVRVRRGVLVLDAGTVALLGGGVAARAAAVRRLRAAEDARVNRRRVSSSSASSSASAGGDAPVALCPPRSAPLVVGSQSQHASSAAAPPPPKAGVVVVAPAAAPPRAHEQQQPQPPVDQDSQEMIDRLLREFSEQEASAAAPQQQQPSNNENNDTSKDEVLVCASTPPSPPKQQQQQTFGTVQEAVEAAEGSAPVTVKAVLTNVESSLQCAGGAFSIDIKIDDGSTAAVVTLSSRVLEGLLGMTPGDYDTLDADSAAAQAVCARLQTALETLEGLFTLERRGARVCATAVAPVSVAYHTHLRVRVATRAAPTVPLVDTLTRAMQ